MCAYSRNIENGSIGRWAKLAGWLIDSQEFSQVVRSSRVEAIITERRQFVLYPWINGQPMKRRKMRRKVVRFRNSQNKASSKAKLGSTHESRHSTWKGCQYKQDRAWSPHGRVTISCQALRTSFPGVKGSANSVPHQKSFWRDYKAGSRAYVHAKRSHTHTHVKDPVSPCQSSVDIANTYTPSIHRRFGIATLSQLGKATSFGGKNGCTGTQHYQPLLHLFQPRSNPRQTDRTVDVLTAAPVALLVIENPTLRKYTCDLGVVVMRDR